MSNCEPNVNESPASQSLTSLGTLPLTSQANPLPTSCFGGRHTVAMISGDGVGPELMDYVKEVYEILEVPIDFEEICVDQDSDEATFRDALLAMTRNGVGIKGNFATEPGPEYDVNMYHGNPFSEDSRETVGIRTANDPGQSSRNLALRVQLDLYAFVQRCRNFPGFTTRHDNVDIVIIRENTEGEYSRIEFSSMIIDNACMQLVTKPQQFDVLVLPNLYGNIVGNVSAGLVGGAGLSTGVNLGHQSALFETGTRNSGRSITGKNLANPCAMLMTSADMLDYLGMSDQASMLRDAIVYVIGVQNIRTRDMCGQHRTRHVVEAITKRLQSTLRA